MLETEIVTIRIRNHQLPVRRKVVRDDNVRLGMRSDARFHPSLLRRTTSSLTLGSNAVMEPARLDLRRKSLDTIHRHVRADSAL